MAGLADVAKNVGIDEIRRHLGQSHRNLPRGGSQATIAGSEQAAVALLVQLAHGTSRVHADAIRGHVLHQRLPGDAQRPERVIRCKERYLDGPRVTAARIERLGIETCGELARGTDVERPRHREEDFGVLGHLDAHATRHALTDLPARRQTTGHVPL